VIRSGPFLWRSNICLILTPSISNPSTGFCSRTSMNGRAISARICLFWPFIANAVKPDRCVQGMVAPLPAERSMIPWTLIGQAEPITSQIDAQLGRVGFAAGGVFDPPWPHRPGCPRAGAGALQPAHRRHDVAGTWSALEHQRSQSSARYFGPALSRSGRFLA
jgi:hypothetical protein